MSKKWTIQNQFKIQSVRQAQDENSKFKIDDLVEIILENRGLTEQKEIDTFLHPKLEDVTIAEVGIDTANLKKALNRIKQAIEKKEQIVIFGDYDVDGITATAILWETLYKLGASVAPYIPGRIEEGYGLSIAGITNLTAQISDVSLIITVDNGIVAHEAVTFAKEKGIDVIITDHHAQAEKNPDADAIVHTTKLCGAGVAWLLSQEIFNFQFSIFNKKQKNNKNVIANEVKQSRRVQYQNQMGLLRRFTPLNDDLHHLELVCFATVADLVPLTGANRTLVKFGLQALQKTTRVGLLALFEEAGIEQGKIGIYEIGHIIAPRLNAMGRMASAMDSLRLLCTKDRLRAKVLADTLGRTNRDRQVLTQEMVEDAIEKVKSQKSKIKNILFVYDETYEQGVIGLVASKLVETYYRPSIVLSKGEKVTKASARSISGFNMIEFIRKSSHLLVNAGGHPMAAGFTVETEKLLSLQESMELLAQEMVTDDMLVRSLRIDCELPLSFIAKEVYDAIQRLQPFGMANQEPIFVSRNVLVEGIRAIGQERKHLKMSLSQRHPEQSEGSKRDSSPKAQNDKKTIDAIAFGFGDLIEKIHVGDAIDIAYVIDENTWNGNTNLQLKIKDVKIS